MQPGKGRPHGWDGVAWMTGLISVKNRKKIQLQCTLILIYRYQTFNAFQKNGALLEGIGDNKPKKTGEMDASQGGKWLTVNYQS